MLRQAPCGRLRSHRHRRRRQLKTRCCVHCCQRAGVMSVLPHRYGRGLDVAPCIPIARESSHAPELSVGSHRTRNTHSPYVGVSYSCVTKDTREHPGFRVDRTAFWADRPRRLATPYVGAWGRRALPGPYLRRLRRDERMGHRFNAPRRSRVADVLNRCAVVGSSPSVLTPGLVGFRCAGASITLGYQRFDQAAFLGERLRNGGFLGGVGHCDVV